MRCNWRRWLWGVIPLAGMSVAAVHLERSAIEKDLTERAVGALAAIGGGWADVNFSGRDVVLSGNATIESEPVEAERVLRGLWGVRLVDNNAGLPPKIEPYVWSARRRGNRVRLFGYVPNRATRQAIIGMTNATLPGLELVDRMKTARGVPPSDTWLAGLSFALQQLAALKKGDVRLDDLALTISGEAEDAEEYRTVSAALKRGLPKGITLASATVSAPVVSPYTWSAQFAGGQLVLAGHVPSDTAKSDVQAAAASAPAGTDLVDRLEVAGGAPADFSGAATALLKQIVTLQSGKAEIRDAAVTVGGVAADEAQAKSVRDGLRAALPAAFKLTDQIRVREPPKVEPPKVDLPKTEPKLLVEPAPPQPPAEQQAKVEGKPAAEPAPPPAAATPQAPAYPQPGTAASPPAPAPEPQPKVAAAAPVPAEAPPPPAPAAAAAPSVPAPPAAKEEPPPVPAAKIEPVTPLALPAPPSISEQLVVCRDDLGKLVKGAAPIAFERGMAKIDDASLETLDRLAAAVKACPGVRIAAEGHADIEGSPDFNRKLSVKRAQVVAEYLISAGVSAEQIETAGFGSSRPVAPNTTPVARAKNRRTEILVRP
jgi:outer membrane protein OmpA-like peptidoglycan-associated protein